MQVKLKQGDGRLIRSEFDTGVVAILDSRANEFGVYRRYVLNALPKRKVTSKISVVTQFIRDIKSAEYFA